MRIGQLGVGNWGRHLVRVLSELPRELPGVELVAVCDPDPRARGRVPPGVEVCCHEAALFERGDLDAVVIATPPDLHHPQAKRALERGLHVFVEKPLARRLAHAEELVALARERALVLMVGHVVLYAAAARWVRDYLAAGHLGDVHHAELARLKWSRARRDIDALWNLAPHDIALANFWFGEEPCAVRSTGVSVLGTGLDDVAHLELDYPSGRAAHIHVSSVEPNETRRAVIVGSGGTLLHRESAEGARVTVYRGGLDGGPGWSPEIAAGEPLRAEARHFIDCVARGAAPLSDGKSGASVVAVLEAATRRPACEAVVA
jgi:predicted dehydrogenase